MDSKHRLCLSFFTKPVKCKSSGVKHLTPCMTQQYCMQGRRAVELPGNQVDIGEELSSTQREERRKTWLAGEVKGGGVKRDRRNGLGGL